MSKLDEVLRNTRDMDGCKLWMGSVRKPWTPVLRGEPLYTFVWNATHPYAEHIMPAEPADLDGLTGYPSCGNPICLSPEHIVAVSKEEAAAMRLAWLHRARRVDPKRYFIWRIFCEAHKSVRKRMMLPNEALAALADEDLATAVRKFRESGLPSGYPA